jgi:hypothetical protein
MNDFETISVELSAGGSPLRFRRHGVIYGVISTPELWFSRRNWWLFNGRAPRGADGGELLEMKMWRVSAVPLAAESAVDRPLGPADHAEDTFDLHQDPTTGEWQLSQNPRIAIDERKLA